VVNPAPLSVRGMTECLKNTRGSKGVYKKKRKKKKEKKTENEKRKKK
jgi:hypothetical protein